MKDFFKLLKRYASPYTGYMAWSIILNILSAVFNIFSFTLIIPILQILFGLDTTVYEFIPWDSGAPVKDMVMNTVTPPLLESTFFPCISNVEGYRCKEVQSANYLCLFQTNRLTQ